MIRRPPRSTQSRSSAASDVYKRQIETPCPMLMVAQLVPVQADSDGRVPPTSPGKSTPVLCPIANLLRYSSRRLAPSAWETCMVPTFDDWLIICVKGSCLVGSGSASLKVPSATFNCDC